MPSPPPINSAAQPTTPASQSKLYKLVMTPIVFTSFLISLAWVEFRYSLLRSHAHDDTGFDSRSGSGNSAARIRHRHMPEWLHGLVYRRQPYRYVWVDSSGADAAPGGSSSGTASSTAATAAPATPATPAYSPHFHYHSMQRKLLKMEAAEAFRIRSTVLFVMGLAVLGAVWAVGLAFGSVTTWLRQMA